MSEPTTVPSLDVERYLGVWYEIARLPMRFEKPDWTDITATYTLNDDGNVRVRNRALDADGELHEAIGEAVPVEGSGNAKLEVSFLPEGLRWIPFTKGDYWVLRVDAAYRTALVGDPQREYLWLLHRDPRIDATLREDFLATARAQGYDLAALIDTPQTGRPTA
jgi:apolipoprotein D and lipocalin family protein